MWCVLSQSDVEKGADIYGKASTSTAPAPVKEEDEEETPAESASKVSPKTKRTRASTTQATASSRAKSTKNEKKIIPMFDRKRRTENMSVADIYSAYARLRQRTPHSDWLYAIGLVTKGIINLNAEYQRGASRCGLDIPRTSAYMRIYRGRLDRGQAELAHRLHHAKHTHTAAHLLYAVLRLHFPAFSDAQPTAMENGSDIMTCMDGKQRITSIKR